MAVILNKQMETIGAIPSKNELQDLVFWLQTNGVSKTYQQTALSNV